ncbi:MAG: 4a-hydroxytetrahydrobiopterin dehydratase [Synechococcus sp.]|nr:4a-hydroxytetrahydrobiopterin dehydratase [Synechococcus sp.]
MDQAWTERQRPHRLERRIEFADYEATRLFLERLEQLSQEQSRYPDISFGRTYVNLTLTPQGDGAELPLGESEHAMAAQIDALLG